MQNWSSIMNLYDVNNVFPSVHHGSVKFITDKGKTKAVRDCMWIHVSEHTCILFTADGCIMLSPTPGAPQGSSVATRVFNQVYWGATDMFLEATKDIFAPLITESPITGSEVKTSATVFVGDMATRVPAKSAADIVALCQTVATEIDRALEAVGAVQNSDKQESLARLKRCGSQKDRQGIVH